MNSFMRRGAIISMALVAGTAFAQDLETDEQKLGYIIGMDIGGALRTEGTEVDIESLLDALRTTYKGETPKLTAEQAQEIRDNYIAQRRALAEAEANAAKEKNRLEGDAFLARNATAEGVITTESGLQYKVLEMGSGKRPAAEDTVEVHYRGRLLNGTEFDSSFSRNQTASFQLNRVIAGWTEGLQLMPVGSKFEFYIKPELAYGESGGGSIPPNATLVFEVELIGIQ